MSIAIGQNTIFSPSTCLAGDFTTAGFKSELVYCGAYSIICVSLASNVDTKITINQSPSSSDTEETLLYETNITANNYFFKRFQIAGAYYSINVANTSSPSVAGKINLYSASDENTPFSASTFLNSKMFLDDDASMIRNGNDYHNDLIRDLHNEFEKVNIQGIVDSSTITMPQVEFTVGLETNFTFNTTGVGTNLNVTGTNDNNPAGTGARTIEIDGILDTGVRDTSTYAVNTGTGTLGLNFLAINRATIKSAGSLHHNEGVINIQESGSNVTISRILATENVSHQAIYKVASNKELILREINIAGYSPSGTLRVIEIDASNNLEYSLGDFKITTNYTQLSYNLDGKVSSGNIVKVNFIPDLPFVNGTVLININVNGILCPLINSYPNLLLGSGT
jgi:hypothetical protein